MQQGKFITFEGYDNVEVSDQIEYLANCLRNDGKSVLVTREPCGTIFGSEVFKLMSSRIMDDDTKAFLMLAMRAEHVRTVVSPALSRGDWVISQRFYHSTAAFQRHAKNAPVYASSVEPSITFYLNYPAKKLLERSPNNDVERIDQVLYIDRVQNAFLKQATKSPTPFVVLDGEEDEAVLFNKIWQCVEGLSNNSNDLYTAFYDLSEFRDLVAAGEEDSDYGKRTKFLVERIKSAGGSVRRLATLPWNYEDILDEFDQRFPNFRDFSEFIRSNFNLSMLGDKRAWFPPVLLLGDPGVGKTMAASWLAGKLGVPFSKIDMGATQTNSPLTGSESFWNNSKPGQVFETLACKEFANPVFLLDELDKVSGRDYDPYGGLYTLLQRREAKSFQDLSLRDFKINASNAMWVATANELYEIPEPIRQRLKVFTIRKPDSAQLAVIAQNIYSELLEENSWGGYFRDDLSAEVVALLSGSQLEPRSMAAVMLDSLGRAAGEKRNFLLCEDFDFTVTKKQQLGFVDSSSESASASVRRGPIPT